MWELFLPHPVLHCGRFTLTEAAATSLCTKERSLKGKVSLRDRILISPNIVMRCDLRHVWNMGGMSSYGVVSRGSVMECQCLLA